MEGFARVRVARTKDGFYSTENKAARRRSAAVVAEARAVLVLHRAGAHSVETIASRRLRMMEVGVQLGGKGDRKGRPCAT
jgi:hypothetical protein